MKKTLLLLSTVLIFSFQTQEVKKIKFEFLIEEVQLIYDALGNLPANKVEALRNKILVETNKQMADSVKNK